MDETIPLRTAFVIMQRYLEFYSQHTGPGTEVGALLGGIQMLQDGGTADPAALDDWLSVAATVIRGGKGPLYMQLKPRA
jgi:hypothetical protein